MAIKKSDLYSSLWASCDELRGGMDASQYPNGEEGVGRRHKKGAVILGFSGQVHFITFEQFQREQIYNKPGLLWCAPDSRDGT